MTDKHEPKTREQLEQEFKELFKQLAIREVKKVENDYLWEAPDTFLVLNKLEELFYDVLKRSKTNENKNS